MLLISKEHKYRHIVFHLGIKLNLVKNIASLFIMELIYCTFLFNMNQFYIKGANQLLKTQNQFISIFGNVFDLTC